VLAETLASTRQRARRSRNASTRLPPSLEPLELREHEIAVVRALTDYDARAALRERGITGPDAVDAVAGLLEGRLR
jgi:hypothetical protein